MPLLMLQIMALMYAGFGDEEGKKRWVARKGVRNLFLRAFGWSGTVLGMGRPRRAAEGGYVYHVLNRANARMRIFADDGDYEAFEKVLGEAVERSGTRLLAY